jgi:hypothetical protein
VPHIDHIGFDDTEAAAGLALLQLQAKASDPMSQPGWVKRRVEKLEFLDTRAVRWEISVDFEVPESSGPGSAGMTSARKLAWPRSG